MVLSRKKNECSRFRPTVPVHQERHDQQWSGKQRIASTVIKRELEDSEGLLRPSISIINDVIQTGVKHDQNMNYVGRWVGEISHTGLEFGPNCPKQTVVKTNHRDKSTPFFFSLHSNSKTQTFSHLILKFPSCHFRFRFGEEEIINK